MAECNCLLGSWHRSLSGSSDRLGVKCGELDEFLNYPKFHYQLEIFTFLLMYTNHRMIYNIFVLFLLAPHIHTQLTITRVLRSTHYKLTGPILIEILNDFCFLFLSLSFLLLFTHSFVGIDAPQVQTLNARLCVF